MLVVLALLGGAAGWVSTPAARVIPAETTIFQATHTLLIEPRSDTGTLSLEQVSFFTTRGEVPTRVAARLGGEGAVLAQRVEVTPNTRVGTLEITAVHADAATAVSLANTFAEELVQWLLDKAVADQQIERDRVLRRISDLEQRIAALDARIFASAGADEVARAERDAAVRQLSVEFERLSNVADAGEPAAGLSTLEAATPVPISGPEYFELLQSSSGLRQTPEAEEGRRAGEDSEPTRPAIRPPRGERVSDPSEIKRAGAGALGGLLLGVALLVVLTRLDRRVRSRVDAEESFGLPVIAEVAPEPGRNSSEIVTWARPRSRPAEGYRGLRTALVRARLSAAHASGNGHSNGAAEERDVTVIMVTSPASADGKTSTATNLAVTLAEAGLSVLVVDCDFRNPRAHEMLGAGTHRTFLQALEEELVEDISAYVTPTSVPGVELASTVLSPDDAPDKPSEATTVQRALVTSARKLYDAIVLDTAPVLATNDASELLPVTDVVVFCARVGRTHVDDGTRTAEIFERLNAPMAGVVLLGALAGPTRARQTSPYYHDETLSDRVPARRGRSRIGSRR